MGETGELQKHDAETKVEKEEKHEKKEREKPADEDEKGENGAEKAKDKKKKDKGNKEKKNPEDKKDPAKLRAKLEKIDSKMQALVIKKDEILKQINEAEKEAANLSAPPAIA